MTLARVPNLSGPKNKSFGGEGQTTNLRVGVPSEGPGWAKNTASGGEGPKNHLELFRSIF